MSDTTSSHLLDSVRRHLSRSLTSAGLAEVADQRAWDDFYDCYHEILTRFARKLSFQSDEVEDLLQDVWFEVIRQLPRFQYDRARGGFRRWLYINVRRRAIDHVRQHAARVDRPIDAASFFNSDLHDPRALDPSAELDRQFKLEILQAAIDKFRAGATASEWETFSLCRLKGLNSAAAAQRLSTTPEAVRKRLERASAKLRRAMADLVGVEDDEGI
jgi:RNA polymerase sigma factor (sigma-70 family)